MSSFVLEQVLLIFGMYFYKDFYLCYNEIQQRESFWCRLTEQKKKDAGESQNLLLEGKEQGIKKCSYYQVIIGRLSQMEGRRFHTPKFMKKEELINYYRQSDIFVMPSITETFGLTYAEALSQSTPIIYSKNQGFDGYYEDGIIGYSVNSKNVKEIAEAIIKIVNNYDFISSNCTINIDVFNWETIVKIYLKIYTQIMNKNN